MNYFVCYDELATKIDGDEDHDHGMLFTIVYVFNWIIKLQGCVNLRRPNFADPVE
jgi:hypothetical protein